MGRARVPRLPKEKWRDTRMVSHASLTRTATNCVCSERASNDVPSRPWPDEKRVPATILISLTVCHADRRPDTLERTRAPAARSLECSVSSLAALPTFRILNHVYLWVTGTASSLFNQVELFLAFFFFFFFFEEVSTDCSIYFFSHRHENT